MAGLRLRISRWQHRATAEQLMRIDSALRRYISTYAARSREPFARIHRRDLIRGEARSDGRASMRWERRCCCSGTPSSRSLT